MKTPILFGTITTLCAIVALAGCSSDRKIVDDTPAVPTESASGSLGSLTGTGIPDFGDAIPPSDDKTQRAYETRTVADSLDVPWDIAFTGSWRMLVTERSGALRQIVDGALAKNPVHVFAEAAKSGEGGLMGMALDPDYSNNKLAYFCLSYRRDGKPTTKIVRGRDEGNSLSDISPVLDGLASAEYHSGCTLRFGPDGKLYASAGDGTEKEAAQDVSVLAGKILRVNADGSVPADNPFPWSSVWSLGHRNPQGLDWQPATGDLYETEHGPSGFDGEPGGDEVNRISKGGNYGWPTISHERVANGTVSPMLVFTPAVAPASGVFYSGEAFPELRGDFLFGGLKGEGVYRIVFSPEDPRKIERYEKLSLPIDLGRVRLVTKSPEGKIYLSTSNTDGRGNPRAGDDRIVELIRKK